MTELKWTNYGDVNPIEHGGFWIAKDEEIPSIDGTCFHVVEWTPTTENVGLLATGYVDISDNWIDWRAVTSYADLHDDSTSEEMARAVFEYYSAEDFGGAEVSLRTSKLVATLMEDHGIPFTPEMMP